jgi:hypothetical protein
MTTAANRFLQPSFFSDRGRHSARPVALFRLERQLSRHGSHRFSDLASGVLVQRGHFYALPVSPGAPQLLRAFFEIGARGGSEPIKQSMM